MLYLQLPLNFKYMLKIYNVVYSCSITEEEIDCDSLRCLAKPTGKGSSQVLEEP